MSRQAQTRGLYLVGVFLIAVSLYYLFGSFHSSKYLSEEQATAVTNDLEVMDHREVTEDLADWTNGDTFLNSLLNLPEWYRRRDWGLKKNVSLETVKPHNDYPGNDEEEIIAWNNFFYGTTNGIVLELGAMEGKNWSVSEFFEAEVGWRSILIEGNPLQAVKIPKNRPNSINFNAVICEKPTTVHFVERGGVGGIVEFMAQGFLKYFHPNLVTNKKLDEKKLAKAENVIKVPCVPLSHLLYPMKIFHINFFMLDVEGAELNVLKAIDFDRMTFDVLAVETDRGKVDSLEDRKNYIDSVIEFLTPKGYVLWNRTIGRNSWFRHPDFTGFSKNPTS